MQNKIEIGKVKFYITVEACDLNGNSLPSCESIDAEDFVLNSRPV